MCNANRHILHGVKYLLPEYLLNPKLFAVYTFVHYFVRPLKIANANTETLYQDIPKGKLNKNSLEPINLFKGDNLITSMPVKSQGK